MPVEKQVEDHKQDFAAKEMAPDKLKASQAVNTFYIRMPGNDPTTMLTYRVSGKVDRNTLDDLLKTGKQNELSASLKFEIADVTAGKYRKLGDSTVLAHVAEKDFQISSKPPAFKVVPLKVQAKAPETKPEQKATDPVQQLIQEFTKFAEGVSRDLHKILDSSHAKPVKDKTEGVDLKPTRSGRESEYGEGVDIEPVRRGSDIVGVDLKPTRSGRESEYGEGVDIEPHRRGKKQL